MKNKAERFRALHKAGSPLVLFNIWDAGSGKAVAKAGAKALATGSWSIAAANGFNDGENISRDLLFGVLRLICSATDLPVSVDIESGYGAGADAVAETVRLSIEAGAIGCNLEDSFPANGSLRNIDDATSRIKAARQAADQIFPGYFINARSDVFFQKPPEEHDSTMLADIVARAHSFSEAGADGLFAPGLQNTNLIRELASTINLPLNIMRLGEAPTIAELADAGVARISHGPHPYLLTMSALERAATELQ
jgi:2-methylisocitrate lyase-like PEP mutase family enzyme